jgi:hypothetical protein
MVKEKTERVVEVPLGSTPLFGTGESLSSDSEENDSPEGTPAMSDPSAVT